MGQCWCVVDSSDLGVKLFIRFLYFVQLCFNKEIYQEKSIRSSKHSNAPNCHCPLVDGTHTSHTTDLDREAGLGWEKKKKKII